jgi:hypothetical protein
MLTQLDAFALPLWWRIVGCFVVNDIVYVGLILALAVTLRKSNQCLQKSNN